MKQVLVAGDVDYNAGGAVSDVNIDIDQLAAGSVLVYCPETQTIITAANAATQKALAETKTVIIAVGGGGGAGSEITYTNSLNLLESKYQKMDYAAPVKQVSFLGQSGNLNLPATLVAGTEAFVKVIDTTSGNQPPDNIERYSYVVKTGDVEADVVAGLVANINANANSIIVAADVASNSISFTAKNFDVTFELSIDGILADATNAVTTAVTFGQGTSDYVTALESDGSPEQGNTNKIWLSSYFYSKASDVVAGDTYAVYSILSSHKTDQTGQVGTNNALEETHVAVPEGAGQEATLDTIFAALFAN